MLGKQVPSPLFAHLNLLYEVPSSDCDQPGPVSGGFPRRVPLKVCRASDSRGPIKVWGLGKSRCGSV